MDEQSVVLMPQVTNSSFRIPDNRPEITDAAVGAGTMNHAENTTQIPTPAAGIQG